MKAVIEECTTIASASLRLFLFPIASFLTSSFLACTSLGTLIKQPSTAQHALSHFTNRLLASLEVISRQQCLFLCNLLLSSGHSPRQHMSTAQFYLFVCSCHISNLLFPNAELSNLLVLHTVPLGVIRVHSLSQLRYPSGKCLTVFTIYVVYKWHYLQNTTLILLYRSLLSALFSDCYRSDISHLISSILISSGCSTTLQKAAVTSSCCDSSRCLSSADFVPSNFKQMLKYLVTRFSNSLLQDVTPQKCTTTKVFSGGSGSGNRRWTDNTTTSSGMAFSVAVYL